jgi:hypothetical protein
LLEILKQNTLLMDIRYQGEKFMDLEKKKFFEQRYRDLDDQDISELLAKRNSLVDEAVAVLENIASQRNIAIPEAIPDNSVRPIPPDNEAQARALWRSKLPKWVNIIFALMLAGPASTLHLGAFPVLVAGLVGWGMSYQLTKWICSDENLHYEDMKAKLWTMLKGGLVGYFALTVLAVAVRNM